MRPRHDASSCTCMQLRARLIWREGYDRHKGRNCRLSLARVWHGMARGVFQHFSLSISEAPSRHTRKEACFTEYFGLINPYVASERLLILSRQVAGQLTWRHAKRGWLIKGKNSWETSPRAKRDLDVQQTKARCAVACKRPVLEPSTSPPPSAGRIAWAAFDECATRLHTVGQLQTAGWIVCLGRTVPIGAMDDGQSELLAFG